MAALAAHEWISKNLDSWPDPPPASPHYIIERTTGCNNVKRSDQRTADFFVGKLYVEKGIKSREHEYFPAEGSLLETTIQ